MTTRAMVRRWACALGASAVALAAWSTPVDAIEAQPARPPAPEAPRVPRGTDAAAAPPARGDTSGPEREEERARALEEIACLEAALKAKAVQVRAAGLRVELNQMRLADLDRQHKKGLVSPVVRLQGQIFLAEAEAERETRLAELKDAESRRDRARRRLALIDRGAEAAAVRTPDRLREERVAQLEREVDRLRVEMDDARRELRLLNAEVPPAPGR